MESAFFSSLNKSCEKEVVCLLRKHKQDFLPLVRSSVYLFSEKMIVVEGKSGVHGCQFHGQKLHKRLETTRAGYFSRQIYPTESLVQEVLL